MALVVGEETTPVRVSLELFGNKLVLSVSYVSKDLATIKINDLASEILDKGTLTFALTNIHNFNVNK